MVDDPEPLALVGALEPDLEGLEAGLAGGPGVETGQRERKDQGWPGALGLGPQVQRNPGEGREVGVEVYR